MKKYVIKNKSNESLAVVCDDKQMLVDTFNSLEEAVDWKETNETLFVVTFQQNEEQKLLVMNDQEFLNFTEVAVVNNKDIRDYYVSVWP